MTRQEQKEARRKEILNKALELFVKKGVYETKISDIAQSVGMSTGLMFHYFNSKESLLHELIKIGVNGTKYPDQFSSLPPDLFFTEFLRSLFSYSEKEPWVFNMFVLMGQASKLELPEETKKLVESMNQIEMSAKIIKKGQKSGIFREGNATALSSCFWASVQGIMEQMAFNKDFKPPKPEWIAAMLKKV